MAMDKVNNYSQVDSNILALQLTTDKAYKGQHTLTLTNYDNTTVPAIAAGSVIEVNGTMYTAASEEAISTTDPVTSATVADGTVYVCIVPGTTAATAAFTATAPTWSDSKQGWYGTGGQANYRYAEFVMLKATSSYSNKLTLSTSSKVLAYLSGNQTINSNDFTKITFNAEHFDTQSEFSTSTNTFTATKAGYYLVSGIVTLSGADNDVKNIVLYKNSGGYPATGYTVAKGHIGPDFGSPKSFNFSIIVNLDPSETISVYAVSSYHNPYTVVNTGTFLSITSLV
jgi:hypothetical protein